MLQSLHISNYILIDSLDITFPEGLVIITGQTGAGKSILLGALSLLAGGKADPSMVSEGADNCVVEAEFDVSGLEEGIKAILEENDVEYDGSLLIRRVVAKSGRSRCFVNDCPVQLQLLASLAGRLIDIHSQHKSLLITDKGFQMSVLDLFAGNGDELQKCGALWKQLQDERHELEKLQSRYDAVMADIDYNSAQLEKLDAAALKEGELEELETEQKSLANAEQIKEALSGAAAALRQEEGVTLDSSLREARRQLEHASRFIPGLDGLAQRLESCRIELDDICDEIERADSNVEMNAGRLEIVEDRMSLIYDLLKKHGCQTVGELIELREQCRQAVFGTEELKESLDDLRKKIEETAKEHEASCSRLHASRACRSGEFASRIREQLRYLELDRADFEIEVSEAAAGPRGCDGITFKFSSNGTAPVDVAKCASGGEISRIMLCLKQMMAKYTGMPTMIFDEIDTGVSGSVADKMGSMICAMGDDMQVFAITHLPQVAAKGVAHYVVEKSTDSDGRTTSHIRKTEGRERVMEIARLLSGSSITDAAIANAESLLQGH